MSPFTWPTLILLVCFISAFLLWIEVRRHPPQRVVTLARLELLLGRMVDELTLLHEHEWNTEKRLALAGQVVAVKGLLEKVKRGDL